MDDSGFFIDFTPDGVPYLGLAVSLPGASLSLVLADKAHARDTLSAFSKAVNELMNTRPRLQVVSQPLPVTPNGGEPGAS